MPAPTVLDSPRISLQADVRPASGSETPRQYRSACSPQNFAPIPFWTQFWNGPLFVKNSTAATIRPMPTKNPPPSLPSSEANPCTVNVLGPIGCLRKPTTDTQNDAPFRIT